RSGGLARLVVELVGDALGFLLASEQVTRREDPQGVAVREHPAVEGAVLPFALLQAKLDAFAPGDVADRAQHARTAKARNRRQRQGGLDRVASRRVKPDFALGHLGRSASAQPGKLRSEEPALRRRDEESQLPSKQIPARNPQQPGGEPVGLADASPGTRDEKSVRRAVEHFPVTPKGFVRPRAGIHPLAEGDLFDPSTPWRKRPGSVPRPE